MVALYLFRSLATNDRRFSLTSTQQSSVIKFVKRHELSLVDVHSSNYHHLDLLHQTLTIYIILQFKGQNSTVIVPVYLTSRPPQIFKTHNDLITVSSQLAQSAKLSEYAPHITQV